MFSVFKRDFTKGLAGMLVSIILFGLVQWVVFLLNNRQVTIAGAAVQSVVIRALDILSHIILWVPFVLQGLKAFWGEYDEGRDQWKHLIPLEGSSLVFSKVLTLMASLILVLVVEVIAGFLQASATSNRMVGLVFASFSRMGVWPVITISVSIFFQVITAFLLLWMIQTLRRAYLFRNKENPPVTTTILHLIDVVIFLLVYGAMTFLCLQIVSQAPHFLNLETFSLSQASGVNFNNNYHLALWSLAMSTPGGNVLGLHIIALGFQVLLSAIACAATISIYENAIDW